MHHRSRVIGPKTYVVPADLLKVLEQQQYRCTVNRIDRLLAWTETIAADYDINLSKEAADLEQEEALLGHDDLSLKVNATLCRMLARKLICKHKYGLEVLRYAHPSTVGVVNEPIQDYRDHPRLPGLPSWCPDWTQYIAFKDYIGLESQRSTIDQFISILPGNLAARDLEDSASDELKVQGVHFGTITATDHAKIDSTKFGGDAARDSLTPTFRFFHKHAPSNLEERARFEDFLRIFRIDAQPDVQPKERSRLSRSFERIKETLTTSSSARSSKHSNLAIFDRIHYLDVYDLARAGYGRVGLMVDYKRDVLSDSHNAHSIGLGFGPQTAQEGDIICWIYGCREPCVLRRYDLSNRYILVGCAFMPDFLPDALIRDKSLEDFILL